MDFQQVNNYIKESDDGNDSSLSLDSVQYYDSRTPYSFQESSSLKPTFTNIVTRIRQQSSKTRLVKDYKKLANESDELTRDQDNYITDNASYIIDPISSPKQRLTQEPDSFFDQTTTSSPTNNNKKPIKRVYINEEANQIQEEQDEYQDDDHYSLEASTSHASDRYITMDEAIVHIQQNIGHMEDEIMRQKKRIELSIQQIKEYSDGISSMKSQESSIMEYLELIHKERIPEMMMQKERIKDSKMAMMNARKQNHVRKRGFEKYRQRISLENRLSEIRMQIQTVIKRDEIWLSIRDWGVLTVVVLAIITTFIISWKS